MRNTVCRTKAGTNSAVNWTVFSIPAQSLAQSHTPENADKKALLIYSESNSRECSIRMQPVTLMAAGHFSM
jgi:hypothetical protein